MSERERLLRLDGRTSVITGAAQGIGAATAAGFADLGANLVLVDRSGEVLDATATLLDRRGAAVASIVGDVRDTAVVEATVQTAVERFGGIDVLVNNAGGGFHAPFAGISAKGEAALIAENFTQVTDFIRRSLPHVPESGASIINVTSIEAHRAGPGFSIYSAMKAALENLTRTLAVELAPRGIRVNCIAPDMIPTPGDAGLSEESAAMSDGRYYPTPLGTMGSAEHAANVAAFLASELSAFVTGTTIHLDGGNLASSGWRRRRSDDSWVL